MYESPDSPIASVFPQTLDDFYTLDLVKMERFNCLKPCPIDALEWNESSSSASGSSDSSSVTDGEEDDKYQPEGEEMAENEFEDEELLWEGEVERTREEIEKIKIERRKEKELLREQANAFLGVSKDASQRNEKDIMSTPQPGQCCALTLARTRYSLGC